MSSNCIIIYPQESFSFYEYSPTVRHLSDVYDESILLCRTDYYESYSYLYGNNSNIKVIQLDIESFNLNNNSNIQTLCNIINVDYPEHNIYGYENYDIFRKDDDVYQNAYESNSNLDVNDIYAIEMDNIDVTNFQLIRDFVIETQFISKLSQYFNLHYAIVSNDAYKKIASNYENNSINILQVFPKNNNIFYLLEFLKRATFFVVSDDIVGALIYTLQTKKTDGKHIINPKIKVYFDLNGHTYDHYKYYTTPKLASWDFCDFNLC